MKLDQAVLVVHPGLQHSHQLAWALQERGWLKSFWSGVPVTHDGSDIPFWLPTGYKKRIRTVPIPRQLRQHPMAFQLAWRLGGMLPMRPGASADYGHRVMHAFDWWMSKRVAALRPKVVVAYENAAYHTFRAARKAGAVCILDAPSFHHAAGAKLMDVLETPYSAEINRRKDAEVEQADLVLTCSPLAARSYVDNNVPADKVLPLLLGAQLPHDLPPRTEASGHARFIFAGVLSHRKSIDLIVEALHRLHAEGIACECLFVGGVADTGLLEAVQRTPNARYMPGVSQAELYGLLRQADALLLPSRFDSFGMVVAEAMACGTPAIVSSQTGAKAIIEQFPQSGWIVDAQGDSIHRQLRELALQPQRLADARTHALHAARTFTWASYRRRATQVIEERLS